MAEEDCVRSTASLWGQTRRVVPKIRIAGSQGDDAAPRCVGICMIFRNAH
jgi:hypothetical protein